jgi:hypothetical protein
VALLDGLFENLARGAYSYVAKQGGALETRRDRPSRSAVWQASAETGGPDTLSFLEVKSLLRPKTLMLLGTAEFDF